MTDRIPDLGPGFGREARRLEELRLRMGDRHFHPPAWTRAMPDFDPGSVDLVGIISDTHGLLRPEALDALRDSDLILHAGDVGDPGILERLEEIAPVVAVRGNMDRGTWADGLALTEVVSVGDVHFYLLHIREELDLNPAAAGIDAVVYGHTHRPAVERAKGVLFLNPGAAGHRRSNVPVTVARLRPVPGTLEPEIVELPV